MYRRLLTVVVAALALGLLGLLGSQALAGKNNTLRPNPANDSSLIRKKLDKERYHGAGGCARRTPKGTKALEKWMKRNSTRNVFTGTIRCDGGVHGTGRALDFGLDARVKKQKRFAMRFINTWLARDSKGRRNALARRMGIQLIIFNCRFWQTGNSGLSSYSVCRGGRKGVDTTQAHIDHIHVELTRPAAKLKTSFWRSGLAGGKAGKGGGGGGSGGL